ncbi:MAG TPA: ATP-binding protein, partial [Steroidobacteraceae bacterium]|nr:ATP-binding protein [Steroidobacteraceae bacterium]
MSTAVQQVMAHGDVEAVQLAQRVAHTLKGAANTVGIRGIAEISHSLEDILIIVAETGELSTELSSIIQDASDCLEAMTEALLGVGDPPPHALDVLQSMLDWIAHPELRQQGEQKIQPAVETSEETATGQVAEAHDHAAPEQTTHEHVTPATDNAPLLRVPMTQVDDLLRLSGESKIIGSQLKEGLRRVESQLHGVRRQNQMLQQLVNELEQLVDIRGVSAPMMRSGNTDFDALEMDQYGELHTLSRRLAEVAVDSRQWNAAAQGEVDSLEELLLSQAQQHNDAQDSILKMRMVPASTIVSRLQRAVRQTCRLLDKQVQLTVQGESTLIDSDSLSQLIDPLMHLLRNAIDHGMEHAEERNALGKGPQGNLNIDFGRDGNQIVVRVKDDGRGLNYAAIHATAIDRGMLQPGAMPSELQLARMILLPGFSTRSEVTQVSGRGIGLDVVHDRVLKLKGTLDVRSVAGQFCEFTIRLPASLLSAHALLIRNGKHTVAIASRGIRQIVDSRAIKLSSMDNQLMAQINDEVYETHRLETLLGTTIDRRNNERGARPALLVEISADRVVAILVQAVLDTVDLVVKPLGKYVPSSIGVVGATILGDGSVAPVMDIPELLRERAAGRYERARVVADHVVHDRQNQAPTVLVVDDSLS